MFELKCFPGLAPNLPMPPPILPPSQTMMTEIALNKVRNEQDKLNEAVRQIAITRSPTKNMRNFESMTNFRVKLDSETTETTDNLDSETITISETVGDKANTEPTTHVLDALIDEDEMTQSGEELSH